MKPKNKKMTIKAKPPKNPFAVPAKMRKAGAHKDTRHDTEVKLFKSELEEFLNTFKTDSDK